MSEQKGNRLAIVLGLLFVSATGLVALAVLLGGGRGPDSKPAAAPAPPPGIPRRTSVFDEARSERELDVQMSQRSLYRRGEDSALSMVPRLDRGPAPDEERQQAAPHRPPPAKKPAPAEPRKLSGKMKAVLDKLMQTFVGGSSDDDENLYRAGATQGLLFRAAGVGLRYPKIVQFVLDNDLVVKGFMKQPRIRQNCHNPQALQSYLMDTKDPTGITLGMKTFLDSTKHPGSTTALMGSRVVNAVMKECTAIQTVSKDPQAMLQISLANPELFATLANPSIAMAMARSPMTKGLLNDVQDSRGAALGQ
ncbi:MAG: hypothetical protein ABII00_16925 [Elusimicrobiota bacterium]